jgi:hypothetical protein
MQELDPEAVRTHLSKILESGGFVKADRLCRFLRFTVEAKLSGQGGQIKEYVLGREVFDRNGAYDPRTDPIVRVEARRLRTKLEEYYSAAGQADALRIEFPKGSYAPLIHIADGSAVAAVKSDEVVADITPRTPTVLRISVWISAVVLLLAAAAVGYRLLRPMTSGLIAVAPSGWLWGETAEATALEESLSESIGIELANQRAARVVGWPLMLRYRTAHQEFRQMAAGLGAARMLLIRAGDKSISVFLLESASGQKLWVGEYPRHASDPHDDEQELARETVKGFVAKEKELATAPR